MSNSHPSYITIIANSNDYDQMPEAEKPFYKEEGEFYLRMNRNLPSDQFAAVTCNRVTIENSILNYDSNLHFVVAKQNYISGKLHIDEIDDFLTAVFGPNQPFASIDSFGQKVLLNLSKFDGPITLSPELANILGFNGCEFKGDDLIYSDKAPDIYRKFRPLYLCADFCDLTTYTTEKREKLLCTIDTSGLGAAANNSSVINAFYSAPIWRRASIHLPIYTQLKLLDSSFMPVPTDKNCKLSIELTFRSLSYYDQL